MDRRIFPFLLLLYAVVCFAAGCKSEIPSDIPPLHPVLITITLDDAPLPGAIVTLNPTDSGSTQTGVAVGGTTGTNGVVTIRTQGRYDGAPLGTYRVCVSKSVQVDGDTSKKPAPTDPQELKSYNRRVQEEKRFVPVLEKVFSDAAKTPLEIEIANGNNTKTFEVKKAPKTPPI